MRITSSSWLHKGYQGTDSIRGLLARGCSAEVVRELALEKTFSYRACFSSSAPLVALLVRRRSWFSFQKPHFGCLGSFASAVVAPGTAFAFRQG